MPDRYYSAATTIKYLALSTSGTLAAGAIGLSEQLNMTHDFLNLSLPYWVFLISMVVLNFVGAAFATQTDYMRANGSRIGNFFTAFFVGLFLSLVVLPVASPSASVGLMQIASFISGLCGTIFLRIIINIMNRQDLQDAIANIFAEQAIKFAEVAIKLLSDHLVKLVGAALIGTIAALAFIPNASDDKPAPQQTEVLDD